MSRGRRTVTAVEFLRLVLDAGKPDRFALRDFFRVARPTALLVACDDCLARGLVERVPVRCGVWFYRLASMDQCRRILNGEERCPVPRLFNADGTKVRDRPKVRKGSYRPKHGKRNKRDVVVNAVCDRERRERQEIEKGADHVD